MDNSFVSEIKIISGGQTGVDRGALDAALSTGYECGGWCPRGQLAEDGRIPKKYPLTELKSRDYSDRTLQNIIHSDGTIILYFGLLEGGTELTFRLCKDLKKHHLLIDAKSIDEQRAGQLIHSFALKHSIQVLNFAGPRNSKVERAQGYAKDATIEFLNLMVIDK